MAVNESQNDSDKMFCVAPTVSDMFMRKFIPTCDPIPPTIEECLKKPIINPYVVDKVAFASIYNQRGYSDRQATIAANLHQRKVYVENVLHYVVGATDDGTCFSEQLFLYSPHCLAFPKHTLSS